MIETFSELSLLFACGCPHRQRLLYPMLQAFGFRSIMIAKTQEEASGNLKFNRFSLIISDLKSEAIDGEELSKSVRAAIGPNGNIPIILFEGESSDPVNAAALESGATAIVGLPIAVMLLHKTIQASMQKDPNIIYAKRYVGPDRRSSHNRPTHFKDQRREQYVDTPPNWGETKKNIA